jgi:CheY-like chemotaxis protein
VLTTRNITFAEDDVTQQTEIRAGAFVCLSISDTGAGIAPETMAHLFEPFFTTKPTGQGTGLGLAMAYGIVKQHDGWIHVYSQLGLGTTFKIYLPAVTTLEVAPPPGSAPPPGAAAQQRILLVEDEDSVRNLANRILRTHGYQVVPARNIAEAEAAWRNAPAPFDLVFSDVVLPDGSGLDLARKISAHGGGPAIVLSSGYSDTATRWPLIAERGYLFLQKPYPKNELLRIIGAALAKK